jgi:hypothetical protein
MRSLDDEVYLLVLETVTDVHVAEFVCSHAVEGLEAGPGKASQQSGLSALIKLHGPAAARLVVSNAIKDVFAERSITVHKRLLLFS